MHYCVAYGECYTYILMDDKSTEHQLQQFSVHESTKAAPTFRFKVKMIA